MAGATTAAGAVRARAHLHADQTCLRSPGAEDFTVSEAALSGPSHSVFRYSMTARRSAAVRWSPNGCPLFDWLQYVVS